MKKILVIDDLPENVFILQDRLIQEGYEVITAYDGNEGLEKANEVLPDLILLDVMMPDISGFEVCKILTNNEKTKHIPIILVTAKASAEDTKEGLEAGAFDYIKKPFNRIELMARVKSALKLSEANKQLLEIEKRTTFIATIVTANHKIKQPLTLLSLSSAALKNELEKEVITKDAILSRIKYIDAAIKDIGDVLNKLNAITNPELSDYAKDVKMIRVEEKEET
ncbi:MAG: Sensor histidine kinase RcsC [Ignavibacteriaceae bacterium]|jgi:two-component system cell cycle response regulator|nr:MAG: response regulator [Chlorobiota bacterium]MBE7475668.1 response regulator [Ignavibacteriales bacterium]MBL1123023.1 response regulator [Ignavibacteriota bacterium]MBV6420037.1 Sensor histidine kinase RcsC [Ignavibacteriaceae bacterium]MCE7856044.1 response regulator [Ignavibacteria bacterium CHB3]MEB2295104.1 response regulator [Ignavibacteria bacterium]